MPEPRRIYFTRPPKPISEMTDAERRNYAAEIATQLTDTMERSDGGRQGD